MSTAPGDIVGGVGVWRSFACYEREQWRGLIKVGAFNGEIFVVGEYSVVRTDIYILQARVFRF